MRSTFRFILLGLALVAATTSDVVAPAHHQPHTVAAAKTAVFTVTPASSGRDHLAIRGAVPAEAAPEGASAASTKAHASRASEPSWLAARGPVVAPPAAGTNATTTRPAPAVVNAPPAAAAVVGPSRANTGWPALDDAINHIRTYYPGIAHWHAQDLGAWGETNMYTGDIYIAPRTPLVDLLSVVEHEFMHALTGHMYGGQTNAQVVADRLFQQNGEIGLEIEADCMARVDGATWTWYTPCTNPAWRATAAILLTGRRL